ncbi:MAG: DUF4013 domain-containing protein [Nanoarchaeota archaeon]|nr:DUF4013 domain-containing protein [Nanoarchaeota archaeon]
MVDYVDLIKKPFSDWKKLSIGALFYLIPFINIITGFFGSGYSLTCANKPKKELPEWKDFGKLFVLGLKSFAIGFLYFLPVLIISTVLVYQIISPLIPSILSETITTEELTTALLALGGKLFLIIALILIVSYITPMAIINFVKKDKFKEAFNFSSILKKILTGKYLLTCIVIILYSIVLSMIAGFLAALTSITIVLPYIFSAYISIIGGITTFSIFGEAYDEIK